jgi:hypothetical protein
MPIPIDEQRGTPVKPKPPAPTPGGGLPGGVPAFNIGAALAAGGAAGPSGPQPLSPADIRVLVGNQGKQLGANLVGPFTPESILGGYAGQVRAWYGENYPKAERWSEMAMRSRMSEAAFGRWLRARPEFASTDKAREMRAQYMLAIAQIFGRV